MTKVLPLGNAFSNLVYHRLEICKLGLLSLGVEPPASLGTTTAGIPVTILRFLRAPMRVCQLLSPRVSHREPVTQHRIRTGLVRADPGLTPVGNLLIHFPHVPQLSLVPGRHQSAHRGVTRTLAPSWIQVDPLMQFLRRQDQPVG